VNYKKEKAPKRRKDLRGAATTLKKRVLGIEERDIERKRRVGI